MEGQHFIINQKNSVIGPVVFRTRHSPQKSSSAFLKFCDDCFFVLFESENPIDGVNNVNKLAIKVVYNEITSVESNIKIICVQLSQEPFWEVIKPDISSQYQRKGYTSMFFTTKKANIIAIRNILFSKNPFLLGVRHLLPIGVKEVETAIMSANIQFFLPSGLIESIPFFTNRAVQSISHLNFSKIYAEKYHFDMELSSMHICVESVDPLFTIKQLANIKYTTKVVQYFRQAYRYYVNLDYALLRGKVADMLVSDPPISVNVFRSSTAIGKFPISQVMGLLKSFIVSGLWQKTEAVGFFDPVGFWMTKIYDRDTWTVPCVSFETVNPAYGFLAINMIKSDNFVHLVRESQAFGKFKKGIGSSWLPDIYNSVFFINSVQEMVVIENIEVIGWDFDSKLAGTTFENLAIERGNVVANFASYIQNKI